MSKKILIGILAIATIFEFVFAVAGFVAPAFTMSQFKLPLNSDTAFLGYAISWLLLFVTLVALLALKQVWSGNQNGWTLSYVLGIWWIGIGVGIYLSYGRPDNLVLDSLKGAIILGSAWASRPGAAKKSGTIT